MEKQFYFEIEGDAVKYFLETKHTHIALMHGCNCCNKMGAGIARTIKQKIPQFYTEDTTFYKENLVLSLNLLQDYVGNSNILGRCAIFELHDKPKKYGINAYTQLNITTQGARLIDIKAVFEDLLFKQEMEDMDVEQIKAIILPQIGAGLGGLEWSEVKPIIQEYAQKLQIKLIVVNFNKDNHDLNKLEELLISS